MPPNTIMHGGTLPLNSFFSFRSKSKPPSPEFTQILLLDSVRLLSGLLILHGNVEYAIATSGSKTVISRPAQSANVAVIEWKKALVETEGLCVSRNEWVDESKWISSRARVFKRWGKNPEIKWEVKNGEWEATNSKKQVLAALTVRRGAFGTRIELTDAGRVYADALVLTGVMSAIEPDEWKWYDFLQARRDLAEARNAAGNVPDVTPDETLAPQPSESLPTYREAPFTQPLGPLLTPTSIQLDQEEELCMPANRPIMLTLASKHPLNGTWYEDDQPVVRVQTVGPRTTISRFIHTSEETEPPVKVVSTISWAEGKVTVVGKGVELGSILGKNKSSVFSKTSRKLQVCTLPSLTTHWTITPHTSSASIYPDPNAHIRYECRSVLPENRPLALLTYYLKRRGTVMELTPEGHNVLVEVLVGVLVLMYGATGEWKKVTGCYLVEPPQEFDEEGKELGPDAQVWKTYVREADRVDEELVDGWNKSVDSLECRTFANYGLVMLTSRSMDVNLIFAALFSAISAAFVIESYKNLKPDPADMSAQTLLVISQTLSSLSNGSQPTSSTLSSGVEATPFKVSPSAICVNVLWFLSLSLSVAVSLISMLAKEWCLEFMSGRTGPPGAQARRRQRRWDGLESWKMKEVLTVLPSLIHLSLLLFAIGLCVFLWDVHYGVAIPVVIVTALTSGTYFACTILPFLIINNYCPYGTVLSRLYKQFFSEYSQSVRDSVTQDETTGKALHWLIVNCETPRSVDVALQSLAAADQELPPAMLERCDAWTLIRQRIDFVDPTGEQANPAILLYKRALERHFNVRAGGDRPYREHRGAQKLVSLVLGVQACINSIIYKIMGQLRPSDRYRSLLEQCALIGPRLLSFECDVPLIDQSTSWGSRLHEYNEDLHAERSGALAENITLLLEQYMSGQIDLEPALQCVFSASLAILLCHKMVDDPSVAVAYIQRLIQTYRSAPNHSTEHAYSRVQFHRATKESNRTILAFLYGVLAVSNTSCFVKESPCFSDSLPGNRTSMNATYRKEKVLELGWKYLMNFVYPSTSSLNEVHYLVHGGFHLLARAKLYNLSPEVCTLICDLLRIEDITWFSLSQEDECCLTHHVQEFTSALTTNPDLDALSSPLLTCLRTLPRMIYGYDYLKPTPESYVLTAKIISWDSEREDVTRFIHLILRFPFPKASPQLIDLFSTSGVFNQLVSSLESWDVCRRAFSTSQLWLLFNMSLQTPDRTSDALSKLEVMLLQYPGLENDLGKQEVVVEDLETRLLVLLDQHSSHLSWFQEKYLYRVLECMFQQRRAPLPREAHEALEGVPTSLRGISSFVDLEAKASDPSRSNKVALDNLEPIDDDSPRASFSA
ncbi:transmembrane protein, putative [Rhizoctonia solani AG-3 Rhs1AP]|uniref:Transmembrane protein, putative n=1 Tax=Rhizoctonia solani AG-3 Rhs1AP TaxID=1086054 RepID=X8JG78_9AGAM|nr:transmembrane protein, putative [Rhizoctonia solani AG-3 Rhs1AP]